MPDYDDVAELLVELRDIRNRYRHLSWSYFELRQAHMGDSKWWTRSGAGSPHELAVKLHDALADQRSGLADYWYFPSGKHNPYLDLLYCEMPAHGYRVRELPSFDQLASLPSGSTVHLHWTQSLRPNGSDQAKNQQALDRARRLVTDFVADPHNRLVWSIHEPLPHGSRWPAQDAEFNQFLADHAHIIHVLHNSTTDVCAEYFVVDQSKTVCAELPLYDSVYPAYRSRENARALLEVAPDELCVVFFGAIRAYKGVDQLLEAARQVAGERKLRLLIAGMPVGEVADLEERIVAEPAASMAPMLVPDTEIQTLLGAADVLVVPYQQFLNSAVLMLGLSFGLPVIATENPVTTDATASGMVTTYRSTPELVDALQACALGANQQIAPDFAAAHAPQAVSRGFATALSEALTAASTNGSGER